MSPHRRFKLPLLAATVLLALFALPADTWACAACFGKSDSALAQGMNMGIFSLLGVITTVLLGVAGFFVFLARKSAKAAARTPSAELSETTIRS